ncbi:DUF6455 family protein [Salipiger sp. 1_MG-2023]|uniref:DUF6455 family protein n=1 Tax=Salipiger sp. 1_MG-2023 TaxID=3062665 RepID=UPI0026E44267|nr:DUF6455 family protein [Salipiger sp. 1_MG-2023]MDO6584802.1 DUF6455 family protein [Salipiger sp. 1_MG-2023]
MFDTPPTTKAQDTRRPRPLGARTDHYWLVQRMARANGTDLAAASDDGHLTQEQWAAMIERCRGCAWVQGCQRWLDQPEQALRDTPANCGNRAHFADLRTRLQAE